MAIPSSGFELDFSQEGLRVNGRHLKGCPSDLHSGYYRGRVEEFF